jgi:3-oxoacyl-[acyl-carrier protein] reductase
MKLAGRSAIITGASRGLGREIARQFVQEGASVLLMARSAVELAKVASELAPPADARVLTHTGDVADPEACLAVVDRAVAAFGGLTALVNNAGVQGALGPIEEVPWDDWARVITINLFGPAVLSQAAIPYFRRQGYGKIVNLSGGGATKPMVGMSAYAASKAALVRLTENLAVDLRGTGIDVNAVAPGALNTQMLDEVLAAGPEKVGRAYFQGALEQQAAGGASPERAAALVVFFASADSDGISGRLISAVWDDWARLPERCAALAAGDVYTLRRVTPADRGLPW